MKLLFLENNLLFALNKLLFVGLIIISLPVLSQNATITGFVIDKENKPLIGATISSTFTGTITDENGFYSLEIISDLETNIIFSHLGFKDAVLEKLILKSDEVFLFNPILNAETIQISGVEVTAIGTKKISGITTVPPDVTQKIPGANEGVENVLKLLPGVSFNNELSTQYNVRGGNFDENLVYVNGIEIYRPFLIRSAQQEGFSFINEDMVQKIDFSSGGFQARYGDKLSSVLDITYKVPQDFSLKVSASLLGAGATVGSISKNNKFSNITGVRYRDNSLFVNSQQTQTNLNPTFLDIQSYSSYQFSDQLSLNLLGGYSINDYQNKPLNRQTNFGTLQEPRVLLIDYEGNENNRYVTTLGALRTDFKFSENTSFNMVSSIYHTIEKESSDVIASYELGDVNVSEGVGTPTNIRGIGSQITRARNKLDALILNFAFNASHKLNKNLIEYGLKFTHEDIRDQLRESEFLDSAGFFIRPRDNDIINNQPISPFESEIIAFESVIASNFVKTNRYSGYLQLSQQATWKTLDFYFNVGARAQFFTMNCEGCETNSQIIISPRFQLGIKPHWEKDVVFRASIGSYQQPPFYRELRALNGAVNVEVAAQKSIHYVMGGEYSFNLWKRPFTLTGEGYYKSLTDVNVYTIEDVRIRYSATNNAKAFAYGFDFRLNGAFVPGTESWVSLGYLKAKENSEDRGYISRPTDQRFKFGVLFQDYIPNIPNVKMYLNLVYNTGVPGGSPNNADPYSFQNRLRDYRRADLGISYIFANRNNSPQENHWLNNFKELNVGFEIFNMFNNQNSITNTWVRDIDSQNQFAVPNFLTSRILNIKLSFRL